MSNSDMGNIEKCLNFNTQVTVSEVVNRAIDEALLRRREKEEPRQYLGASQIGDECLRKVQLIYEQHRQKFAAENLRALDIGTSLEANLICWLRQAGFKLSIRNQQGEQYGFTIMDGKLAGHVDGIITAVPEGLKIPLFRVPCIWEAKTMKAKSWKETEKKGIMLSKPMYYAQIQMYMMHLEMRNPALISCLNKDTSELYHELVIFDQNEAEKYSKRAVEVIEASEKGEILPCVSKDINFFRCKMCGLREICLKMRGLT